MLITNFSSMFVFLLILLHLIVVAFSKELYTNQFVIHCKGGEEKAKELGEKHNLIYLGKIFDDHYHFKHRRITKRSIRPHVRWHTSLKEDPEVLWFSQQTAKRRVKRDLNHVYKLNDPLWPEMWYLNRGRGLDMNVQEAWAQGATGKGVVVTILDDGLEKDHPDIRSNYDSRASFDVNNQDPDPQPRYDFTDSNRHGTRCAGEVAAEANNSLCTVGVAYNAGIGGVRMLDGDVTDAVEARSIGLNPQHIHIYSASWGPDDDGKTVDGPGKMATAAFQNGVTYGRGGLGSIFVWASGNGGREKDNCNCDGYTNSIWTLSISSATENGLVPWYSEACSSTLATTYSSGSVGEKQISTTDLHNGCTTSHTGTSASAPLAAGICALALDANPRLTWRDMQHLVVRTSRPHNLFDKDWKTNGVGRNVSHSYGYGMMDAGALVALAKNWTTVPKQRTCQVNANPLNQVVLPQNYIEVTMAVNCDNVNYLEHVQAVITLTASRRGDIRIFLTSPYGTRSTLLDLRPQDNSRTGFKSWPFLTVHNWGEHPNGIWKLEIHNEGKFLGRPMLNHWSLILYGTKENPDAPQNRKPSPPNDIAAAPPHIEPIDAGKPGLPPLDNHNGNNGNHLEDFILKTSNLLAQSECRSNLFSLANECLTSCPSERFTTLTLSDGRKICADCHYSCRTCEGTNDYNCTSCFPDALLGEDHSCVPATVAHQLRLARRSSAALAALLIALVVAAAVALGAWCACWALPRCTRRGTAARQRYRRLGTPEPREFSLGRPRLLHENGKVNYTNLIGSDDDNDDDEMH